MDKAQFEKRVLGLKEKLGKLKEAVTDLKQSVDSQEDMVSKFVKKAKDLESKKVQS